MPLPQGDTEKVSKISLLFTLSFSILLALGALSMAYANFMLGFVLFMLGLILLVGNEFLVFRKLEKKARQEPLPSPAKLLF